jgi:hypothetical protein
MQNKYITSLYDEKYIIFLSKIYIFAKDAANTCTFVHNSFTFSVTVRTRATFLPF